MNVPPVLLRSAVVRRGLRRTRRLASDLAYRLRARLDPSLPTRVATGPAQTPPTPIPHPAVLVPEGEEPATAAALRAQTETSWTTDPAALPRAPYLLLPGERLGELPATTIESLLMVLAAQPFPLALAGAARPRTAPDLAPPFEGPVVGLLDLDPRAPSESVVGRRVLHVDPEGGEVAASPPGTRRHGAYLLREDAPTARRLPVPLQHLPRVLGNLPPVEGPPTVLFVLPFLAVGGAEQLLFRLIEGLGHSVRSLVVTLEPHLLDRGQTVTTARELTPFVYTLGDWLPREARIPALCHLIRRYRVATLFGWNGATDFYDRLPELRRDHPNLRILNQLFNHRGGWIEHLSRRRVADIDLHVAINSRVAEVLERRFGVPPGRIAEIHHAIEIPDLPEAGERRRRRQERRRELGIPTDALVAGTFVRMHPQKRPLDVLAVADRMVNEGTHFLLVGGGPLDDAVDDELRRSPRPNVTRLPLQDDPEPLFDALDLCLMTSEYEGLPVFLLEGLARELPAVAPAVGDVPLLLASGGGRVVSKPGAIDELVEAVRSFADPDRRHEAGRVGRTRVAQDFSLERYVRQYREAIFP